MVSRLSGKDGVSITRHAGLVPASTQRLGACLPVDPEQVRGEVEEVTARGRTFPVAFVRSEYDRRGSARLFGRGKAAC